MRLDRAVRFVIHDGGGQYHTRLRWRVQRRRRGSDHHPSQSSPGERVCRTLGEKCPSRVVGPHHHLERTAAAGAAQGVRRPLRRASPAPLARTTSTRERRRRCDGCGRTHHSDTPPAADSSTTTAPQPDPAHHGQDPPEPWTRCARPPICPLRRAPLQNRRPSRRLTGTFTVAPRRRRCAPEQPEPIGLASPVQRPRDVRSEQLRARCRSTTRPCSGRSPLGVQAHAAHPSARQRSRRAPCQPCDSRVPGYRTRTTPHGRRTPSDAPTGHPQLPASAPWRNVRKASRPRRTGYWYTTTVLLDAQRQTPVRRIVGSTTRH